MRKLHQILDDYVIWIVLSQPILVVLQFLMLYVFAIPEEVAAKYRVILTALPLSIAIFVCFKRNPRIFITTYPVVLLFLAFQSLIFPENISEIWSSTTRFLLPIIIPSTLCLISMRGHIIEKVEYILYKISWIIVIMMLFFVYRFISGRTVLFNYNMGLAYALLLPAITLYKNKGWCSSLASLFLLVCILIFGSRGPLLVAALYIIYDKIQVSKRNLVILIFLFIVLISLLPLAAELLENFGISSRTLSFLLSGNIIAAEGRDEIYGQVQRLISNNLLFGVGIFGDRVHLDELCHNVILEVIVNYGIVIGVLLICSVFFLLLKIYIHLDSENKNKFVKYFIAMIMPLFFSDSYLTSIYFGLFWGIILVLKREVKSKVKHDIINVPFSRIESEK